MLNYISLYPNIYEKEFNDEIILGTQDDSIASYVIMEMMELEDIENITIEKVEVVMDQDEIDINNHMVNINYKKKDMSSIEIPKRKYINDGRYGEVRFTITVATNLNSKTILKRILIPIEHDGFYYNSGKRMKAIWQVIDEATYSQRGKNTLKSRMPVIIYQNKKRPIVDVLKETHIVPSYSYALNGKQKKGAAAAASSGKAPKTKFINPIMIYSAKMGYTNTLEFFGMKDIVYIDRSYDEDELEDFYIFPLDDIFIKADKVLFDKYDLVRSFVCMTYNLKGYKDLRVNMDCLDDRRYWTCRIGMVGAARNKNIESFYEKGSTNLLMIERLLNSVTKKSLRLPEYYKQNIYYLLYWLITNFEELRRYTNTDMRSKRIRKNEYIVNSSLGKKLSDNVNKLIERKSRSKMNNMDTLLEIFNFGSDIVVAGMRNLNDLIKTDDIVNDMDFIQSLAFSNKGYQSLGESNSKMIAVKYRYLDPSMVGVLDLNVSSNSDIGMSGSFVPFVKLYDGFFFTPEHQPCKRRYEFEKALEEDGFRVLPVKMNSFEDYLKYLENGDKFKELLKPEKIVIVEKTTDDIRSKRKKNEIEAREAEVNNNDSNTGGSEKPEEIKI